MLDSGIGKVNEENSKEKRKRTESKSEKQFEKYERKKIK